MMTPTRRFAVVYATQVKEHLRSIDRKFHSLIRHTIEEQLQFEPDVETKNRKPLKRPVDFGATWELRFGSQNQFRVFYDLDQQQAQVSILAVGVKRGHHLFIGNKEVEL